MTAASPYGPILLPALLLYFPAPHSYTGEEVVELHTLSNPVLVQHLVLTLTHSGARPAEAGEFTRRAVLNGKMDLTRAEGVAAVIAAQNDAELRAGQALLAGHLAQRVARIQTQLRETLALLEAGIDFVDEGIGFLPAKELTERITTIQGELQELLAQPSSAERAGTLPRTVIMGRPNAGKSTLFNALLGRERAIASPTPGTTRDVLRGQMPLSREQPGVELFDTAGVEEQPGEAPMEKAMHTQAMRAGQTADLVIWVNDLSVELEPWPPLTTPPLLVGSKSDLLPPGEVVRRVARWQQRTGQPVYAASAQTGAGLEPIRQAIRDRLGGERSPMGGEQVGLGLRHREGLREAQHALERVRSLLGSAPPTDPAEPAEPPAFLPSGEWPAQPEILAIELRAALHHLGRMVGETLTDDLLDLIFSRFCIGK